MNDTNIGKTRDAFGVHSKLWTKLQRSPLTCFPEFHLLPFRKINPPQNTTPRENIAGRGVKYMPGGYPEQHLTAELQERVTCASCFSFPAIKKVPILEQKPSQELSWEGHQPSSPGVLFPPGRDERECGGGSWLGEGLEPQQASVSEESRLAYALRGLGGKKTQTGRRGIAQFHRTALCLPPQQPQRSPQE